MPTVHLICGLPAAGKSTSAGRLEAETGGVLFTVRTYQIPIAELVQLPDQACRLLGTLRTASGETLEYKGIAPFATPLMRYLERHCAE